MSFEECAFYSAAISAALDHADVSCDEAYCTFACKKDQLYVIAFRTDYLKYDCYVDADTMEVLGFSFEPIPDIESAEHRVGGELWEPCAGMLVAND